MDKKNSSECPSFDEFNSPVPEPDNVGLGQRYLNFLLEYRDKIHQVDASSAQTETNGSVRLRAIQLAEQIVLMGVVPSDNIVICSKTREDQTIAVLATIIIGAVVVPLDPEYTIEDLEATLAKIKPRVIFCEIRMYGFFDVMRKNTEHGFYSNIILFGSYINRITLESLLIKEPDPNFKPYTVVNTRTTVGFIVPSASTMGPSKLVTISHYAMKVQVHLCWEIMLKGMEKILSFFPLSWIPQLILTCMCFERPIVKIIAEVFNERVAARLIHDLRIDCALFGTSYALQFVNHPAIKDFSIKSLKAVYVGGRVTTAVDMTYLRERFEGVQVIQCYGLTEMCCVVTTLSPSLYKFALEKPGSVGRLLPIVQAKIICFDTGEILNPGLWGKLYVSGPTVTLGYYNKPGEYTSVIENDYFCTGDIAQFDDDGFLYLQGRVADVIETRGRRIFPIELEDIILTHYEVKECVVVGDENRVVACVTRKEDCYVTEQELNDYLEELLPEKKRPSRIQFFDSFPKTPVGKVKIGQLRDMVLKTPIQYSISINDE